MCSEKTKTQRNYLIMSKKGCQPILTYHVRIRQRLVNERQIMPVDKLEQLPIGHWKPRSARLILLWVRWRLPKPLLKIGTAKHHLLELSWSI